MTQVELLRELQPTVEENLNRHLAMAKSWETTDYVPSPAGPESVGPAMEFGGLTLVAKAAMVTNLLTEDNLPAYHRDLTEHFRPDDAWGSWVRRWTEEENRHGVAMRDYLVATRSVDPAALDRVRMEHPSVGVAASPMEGENLLHSVAYVTFQELATRVSHRNTARECNDPVADRLLQRIAADENLHMAFYRNLAGAALDLDPDRTFKAIVDVVMNFQMPGLAHPQFQRNAVLIAKYGIYDLRQHLDEVLLPVVNKWNLLGRNDLGAEGESARYILADYLDDLEQQARRFEQMRDAERAREAGRRVAV